jgi:hypothetical protein
MESLSATAERKVVNMTPGGMTVRVLFVAFRWRQSDYQLNSDENFLLKRNHTYSFSLGIQLNYYIWYTSGIVFHRFLTTNDETKSCSKITTYISRKPIAASAFLYRTAHPPSYTAEGPAQSRLSPFFSMNSSDDTSNYLLFVNDRRGHPP